MEAAVDEKRVTHIGRTKLRERGWTDALMRRKMCFGSDRAVGR